MTNIQAKVLGEYYTVATDVGSGAHLRGKTREGRYETISAAVEAAMRITLDRKVSCKVLRITEHEPVKLNLFGFDETETVTGEVMIPGPRSYNYDPALSRYHPVNGWVVPDVISFEED